MKDDYKEIAEKLHLKFFISHMVQMKGAVAPLVSSSRDNFISHMVQMKVWSCLLYELSLFLYIPHGSDES